MSSKLGINFQIVKQRIESKERRLKSLQATLASLEEDIDYTMDDPESTVQGYLAKLRQYNDLKDIAMGLVGVIADNRLLKMSDILQEMQVDDRDNKRA